MIRRKFLKFLGAVPVVGAAVVFLAPKEEKDLSRRYVEGDVYRFIPQAHNTGLSTMQYGRETFAEMASRTLRKAHIKMIEEMRETNALLGWRGNERI